MSTPEPVPASPPSASGAGRENLLRLMTGTWIAQSIYAVAALGVPDLLCDGPRTAAQLAAGCDADPDALYRILRATASVGLFDHDDADRFALTALSDLLRDDVPGSVRQTALMLGEEVHRSFGELLTTARTGKPGFDHAHGTSMYEYLSGDAARAQRFNAALGSRRDVPAALWTCDLTHVRTVVDVGGGNGNLLAELLAAHPDLRGTLLELPDAVRQARDRMAEVGVADRATLVEGDFFAEVPAGADLYLLARCLHNWSDANARRILRTVRAAMAPGSRLVLIEKVVPAGPGPSLAKLYDLLMLATVEGRNRTEAEYAALLGDTGFTLVEVRGVPESGHRSEYAIEAAPASVDAQATATPQVGSPSAAMA